MISQIKERPILFSAPMVRAILEGRKTQTRRIVRKWHFVPGYEGMNLAFSGLSASAVSPGFWRLSSHGEGGCWNERAATICPQGKPGDRLWVRETWASPEINVSKPGRIAYNADGRCGCVMDIGDGYRFWGHGRVLEADGYSDCFPDGGTYTYGLGMYGGRWRPSIHMPRWASRILLEITDVRVQRLQEISEANAIAEGASPWKFGAEQTLTSGERGAASPYRGGFACLWDEINADRATWYANPWVWAITFKRTEDVERAA